MRFVEDYLVYKCRKPGKKIKRPLHEVLKKLVKCQSKRNFARVNAIDTAIFKKKIKIWLYFYAVFMLK